MKRTFTLIVSLLMIAAFIISLAACSTDPLTELLDELNETQSYRTDVTTFGVNSTTISSAYFENITMTTGYDVKLKYLENTGEGYNLYYQDNWDQWICKPYTGSLDGIKIDSAFLLPDNYEPATEQPNTYKFKEGVAVNGVDVKEVRLSLSDRKISIVAPPSDPEGNIMKIDIHGIGETRVSLPEVK